MSSPSNGQRTFPAGDGRQTLNPACSDLTTEYPVQHDVSSVSNHMPESVGLPRYSSLQHDISDDCLSKQRNSPLDHQKQSNLSADDWMADPENVCVPQLQRSEKHLPPVEPPEEALTKVYSRNCASVRTTATTQQTPEFEVDWENEQDPENPLNWSVWYKGLTIFFVSWGTFCVVLYSTSYTTGLAEIGKEFHVASQPVVTLGLTSYLLGLAIGSMVLAPMSEMYGRRPVYIVSMFMTTILIIPCARATSLAELIVVRFFGAFFGGAMLAISPGSISDIATPEYRALAFSIWAIGPLNGPTFGPLIGGFSTQYLGWRWTNWIVMIATGAAFGFMLLMRETYAPAILREKAKMRRKETNDERYWCRFDNKKTSIINLLKINLSRPFVMVITEPICLFWDIYIAIIYGILYLCFVAYPIVFTDYRHWDNGITGLSFIGIAIGCFICLGLEPLIRRLIMAHKKDAATGKPAPEAMVSVICIAAVLSPVGQLWFAWTCIPPVHWVWPIVSGIPFGAGNTAIFIYATNYLAQSYGLYGASALAGNSVIRSVIGGVLPLAGPSMYKSLTPHWAGTMLGLIQVACIPIPVLFYKYGYKIRMRSTLIRSMQAENEKREVARQNSNRLARRMTNDGEIDARRESVSSGNEKSNSKRFSASDEDLNVELGRGSRTSNEKAFKTDDEAIDGGAKNG